jgi:hypothetical protein
MYIHYIYIYIYIYLSHFVMVDVIALTEFILLFK